jgi:dihydrofolate reductase
MASLTYSMIASLDGYVADLHDDFSWAAPEEEVHAFVNDLERTAGTYLYGRRMYEVMVAWETMELSGQSSALRDFAEIWRAADKIVYSTTLEVASSARTRIERGFDAGAIREMKASLERDISIGGPGLAAHAIRAGVVDEYRVLVVPTVVGGGTFWLPDDVRLDLELLDEHRFTSGVVYLRYRSVTTEGLPSRRM